METPHRFDPNEPDGLHGDPDALIFSLQCGAEGLYYEVKDTAAHGWLAGYGGSSGGAVQDAARDPQELPTIDEELPAGGDVWE